MPANNNNNKPTKRNYNKSKPKSAEASSPARKSGNYKKHPQKSRDKVTKTPALPIHYTVLGGLNEIGKNMAVLEYGDDAIIIDCGMSFPDEDLLGVDVVLPDFTYVNKIKDKVRGIFITHGHEDHIGALPYLLKQMDIPVYAGRLTVALIDSKLKEHGLSGKMRLNVVEAGHFETENPAMTVLAAKLSDRFPAVEFCMSEKHKKTFTVRTAKVF